MSDISLATGAAPVGAGSAARAAIDRPAVIFALLALALFGALTGFEVSGRMAALLFIGAGLGFALLHGAFGFTAGWRNLVLHGDGRGFRAQLLVIGLAMLGFIPLINAYGPDGVVGAVAPVGTSLVVGSFMFGLGMQLGNGCGSGTLFTLGGGSARMLATLIFFIVGSVIGSIHLPWWLAQPGWNPVNLADTFGIVGTLALQGLALGALAWLTLRYQKSRGFNAPAETRGGLLSGPWPFVWAAVALAILDIATLLVAGHPWTITYGFALWGAKTAQAVGFDMSAFEFWQWSKGKTALENSLLADVTSVMNIGLILGAMLAAGLSGSFAKPLNASPRFLAAAVIGGLLMGYGARLSFGCNIGAFLGGIASGSLHGWIWFVCAFAGTMVGLKLRPHFGFADRG
jgi:uncharacterized membrane protein YedE/YeeE